MDFIECRGLMIPGLTFDKGCTIWLLHWAENPVSDQPLTEVWLFHGDGQNI